MLAPPASDLVHALKYEGWGELAPFMARRMGACARLPLPPDAGAPASGRRVLSAGGCPVPRAGAIVVAVPTTTSRARQRGYNQAAMLARPLAAALRLPVVEALTRVGARGSQTELAPTERRANVRGAFGPGPDSRSVVDRPVLLIDDVLTTGATASEAATVLAEVGATSVHVLTFARALPEVDSGLS